MNCSSCNNCNCHNEGKTSSYDCDISFLKPLNIICLFGSNNNNTCDILEKTKKIRNSFFAAKTVIDNFVASAISIQEILQKDLSDVQLERVKERYLSSINTLTSGLYNSLTVNYDGSPSYTTTYSKVQENTNIKAPRTTKLRFKSGDDCNQVILSTLPGFLIIYNEVTKEVRIKIRDMKSYDPELYFDTNVSDNVNYDYVIAPGISYGMIDPSDNILDPSDNLVNMDIFLNIDLARDFIDEIVYYKDISGQEDYEGTFGNKIYFMDSYLDNMIVKMENTHKYIVQQAKIDEFTSK